MSTPSRLRPSDTASLLTYDSKIDPPSGYPTLPAGGIVESACLPALTNTTFHVQITGGVDGAVVPAGINTNETVYLVRHAEAHPTSWWEDGNYVGPGQWRALDLPYALQGKIQSQGGLLHRSRTGHTGQPELHRRYTTRT